jgi:hypothetical protein
MTNQLDLEPYSVTLVATIPEYRRVGFEPADLNLNEVICHVCNEFQAESLGAEWDDSDYSWRFGFDSSPDAERAAADLRARGFRVEKRSGQAMADQLDIEDAIRAEPPKPDPRCKQCGGTGRIVGKSGVSFDCSCVKR